MELSTGKKGAMGELAATVWLLSQGYEVFRNVAQDGAVDLIATKGGEITKIDVKTAIKFKGKEYPLSNRLVTALQARGIRALVVWSDGRCIWQDPS